MSCRTAFPLYSSWILCYNNKNNNDNTEGDESDDDDATDDDDDDYKMTIIVTMKVKMIPANAGVGDSENYILSIQKIIAYKYCIVKNCMFDCIDEVSCVYTTNSIVVGASKLSVIELTCLWASFVL